MLNLTLDREYKAAIYLRLSREDGDFSVANEKTESNSMTLPHIPGRNKRSSKTPPSYSEEKTGSINCATALKEDFSISTSISEHGRS